MHGRFRCSLLLPFRSMRKKNVYLAEQMLEVKANDMSIMKFVKGKSQIFPVQEMKAYEGVEAEFRSLLDLAVCCE